MVLAAVLLAAAAVPVLADHVPVPGDPGTTYSYTGKSFTLTEDGTTYTYKIYASSNDYYRLYTNLYCSSAVYHTQGGGSFSITSSIARTYSSEYIKNFNVSLGYTAVTKYQLIGLVNKGYGIMNTVGHAFQSGEVQYNMLSNDPTGYYRIYVLYNYSAYRLRKYNGASLVSSIDCVAPYGDPYYAICVKTSGSTEYVRYRV